MELEKANQNSSVLEAKLNHARRMLDKEKKRRLEAEGSSAALVRKLRNCVFMRPCMLVDMSADITCVGAEILW